MIWVYKIQVRGREGGEGRTTSCSSCREAALREARRNDLLERGSVAMLIPMLDLVSRQDTPGYGDQLDLDASIKTILNFVEAQVGSKKEE